MPQHSSFNQHFPSQPLNKLSQTYTKPRDIISCSYIQLSPSHHSNNKQLQASRQAGRSHLAHSSIWLLCQHLHQSVTTFLADSRTFYSITWSSLNYSNEAASARHSAAHQLRTHRHHPSTAGPFQFVIVALIRSRGSDVIAPASSNPIHPRLCRDGLGLLKCFVNRQDTITSSIS